MILIVDDEAPVRATIGRALAELGFRVCEAANGYEAMERIAEERPQLVILDYVMPGMDGAATAREIAEIDPDLPVIFSTGHGALRALRDAAGDDASILQKPFTLAELDALLARMLGAVPRLRTGS
jgi:DNA-binding NtrC family response regulator